MDHPQYFIGQKVIYRSMPKDPLTLLTITDIKGTQITAELPGGARITSETSSFQKFVPKEKGEESDKPKKNFFKSKKKPVVKAQN